LYQGIQDKVSVAYEICNKMGITLNDVAYIGDDIGDIALLKLTRISAAPSNASLYIQKEVDFVTQKKGGEGAFREFVEIIIGENNIANCLLDY
jgi:3-deoxy-D-manno-octulosonate 8-phosphate phosphatase (KDO 8-P phosphatase)